MGEAKKAILCTLLQLTIVGWIPSVLWAFAAYNCEDAKKQKVNKILDNIRSCKVA